MRANVVTRLERLEAHAAPFVERARQRRVEIEKFRAWLQPDIDTMMALANYCGLPLCRKEAEDDVIEGTLLISAEVNERYGEAYITHEQTIECIIQSDIKLYRELCGQEYSADDILRAGEVGERAREDMRAGIPAIESEAAQEMIRQQAIQPPRLKRHTDVFAAYMAGLDSRIPEFVYNDE